MDLENILHTHGVDLTSWSVPDYQRAGKAFPIYLLHVPAAEVIPQWEILRALVPKTGYWPVIGWDRFKEPPWEEEPVQDLVAESLRVDLRQWFETQWRENGVEHRLVYKKDDAVGAVAPFQLRLHIRRRWSLVPITLLPTPHGWEAPAYLEVSPNDWDPPPPVHVALLRSWQDRWGAEVVSLVSGAMELRVLRPPTTWEEAFQLAKEQYAYAPDLVEQDPGVSITTLAKILLKSRIWYFWWD